MKRPWGRMRAGDLMASWVGHDLLHMRQLSGIALGLHKMKTAYVVITGTLHAYAQYAGPELVV